MTIHFIHGIHTSDKDNVTAKLAPEFRAVFAEMNEPVFVRRYGYALALTTGLTNWLNNRRASKLAKHIADGDSIVAHSNGCAVAYLIQRDHRMLKACVLIQPALDNWRTFENTEKILVVYNDEDDVVGLSTLGFASAWGDMGRVGYKGSLQNADQWDSKNPPDSVIPYKGHSGIVAEEKTRSSWSNNLAFWLKQILKKES